MRRATVNILVILLAFVAEYSFFPFMPFIKGAPNLLLIFTFSIAFVFGELEGIIYGCLCGLLMDLIHAGPFGIYTLIFAFVGYMNGMFSRYYYDDYIFLPAALCLFNVLGYNLYLLIVRYFTDGRTDFLFCLKTVILPELVLSILFTLLLYRPFLACNRALQKIDIRRRKKKIVS